MERKDAKRSKGSDDFDHRRLTDAKSSSILKGSPGSPQEVMGEPWAQTTAFVSHRRFASFLEVRSGQQQLG